MSVTVSCVRGCGTRSEGGTYLCTGQGYGGQEIEKFIVDPPIKVPMDFQRGFKIIKLPNQNHNDVLIFVGEEFYKSPWDFIEEARRFGISRKVPPSFPFHKLTPGLSRMLFVHSKGFPDFEYQLNRIEKPEGCKYKQGGIMGWHKDHLDTNYASTPCTYAYQDLAYFIHNPEIEIVEGEVVFNVKMPEFSYSGIVPEMLEGDDIEWSPAIFLATYVTHIEYPHKENLETKSKVNKAGFDTEVCNW